ncbi:hypothetical protein JCM8097_007581 [Rhodosporidiobolus ruineniae]
MSSMRDPDAPLKVHIVVYDLLPPSRLASFLNFGGCGVYHSSVQLSMPRGPTDLDPTPLECAFGGHDSQGVTGIFSIPAGTAAQRMPGLRLLQTIDAGEAFGEDWQKAFGPKRPATTGGMLSRVSSVASEASKAAWKGKDRAADQDSLPETPSSTTSSPYSAWFPFSRSTTTLANDAEDPFEDPDSPWSPFMEDDGGVSDGTEYLTKAERRAWRIIQAMRQDEEWNGTRYRLLEKNCNSFTHELIYRLTGRPAPAWLNRAAWVATSLPCIVPAGWIDDADEAAPTASAQVPDPAHALSKDGSVTIAPPRADKMEMGGRT